MCFDKFINPKISYLLPNCGISGGVAVVLNHVNRLSNIGFTCNIISEGSDLDTSWFPNQGVPVFSLKDFPDDVDILIATAWSTAFTVADLPANRKFYFVQSDETRFHPRDSLWQHLARLSYGMNFEYITEARWIQKWLLEKFGHRAHLVPNGIDRSLFYNCDPLIPKGRRPRILLEGAIGLPYKGMADAFAAVQDLNVEVWCVSSYGDPQPYWKCDRFFKQVPMDKMREIYSSCDILLKMSRVEGFFGPPLEMMACGGVSVVGKVTGYDEYIINGVNAIVVEQGDVSAARNAIEMLINNPEIYNKIRDNGIRTAAEWSWDRSIQKLSEIYNSESSVSEARNYNSFDYDNSIAVLSRYCLNNPGNFNLQKNDISVHVNNAKRVCNRLMCSNFFCYISTMIVNCYSLIKKLRFFYLRRRS